METGMLTHFWQTTKQWNTGLSEVMDGFVFGFVFKPLLTMGDQQILSRFYVLHISSVYTWKVTLWVDHTHTGGDEHGEQLFENKRLCFNPAFKYLMSFEARMLKLDKFKIENGHISNNDGNSIREKAS